MWVRRERSGVLLALAEFLLGDRGLAGCLQRGVVRAGLVLAPAQIADAFAAVDALDDMNDITELTRLIG